MITTAVATIDIPVIPSLNLAQCCAMLSPAPHNGTGKQHRGGIRPMSQQQEPFTPQPIVTLEPRSRLLGKRCVGYG